MGLPQRAATGEVSSAGFRESALERHMGKAPAGNGPHAAGGIALAPSLA